MIQNKTIKAAKQTLNNVNYNSIEELETGLKFDENYNPKILKLKELFSLFIDFKFCNNLKNAKNKEQFVQDFIQDLFIDNYEIKPELQSIRKIFYKNYEGDKAAYTILVDYTSKYLAEQGLSLENVDTIITKLIAKNLNQKNSIPNDLLFAAQATELNSSGSKLFSDATINQNATSYNQSLYGELPRKILKVENPGTSSEINKTDQSIVSKINYTTIDDKVHNGRCLDHAIKTGFDNVNDSRLSNKSPEALRSDIGLINDAYKKISDIICNGLVEARIGEKVELLLEQLKNSYSTLHRGDYEMFKRHVLQYFGTLLLNKNNSQETNNSLNTSASQFNEINNWDGLLGNQGLFMKISNACGTFGVDVSLLSKTNQDLMPSETRPTLWPWLTSSDLVGYMNSYGYLLSKVNITNDRTKHLYMFYKSDDPAKIIYICNTGIGSTQSHDNNDVVADGSHWVCVENVDITKDDNKRIFQHLDQDSDSDSAEDVSFKKQYNHLNSDNYKKNNTRFRNIYQKVYQNAYDGPIMVLGPSYKDIKNLEADIKTTFNNNLHPIGNQFSFKAQLLKFINPKNNQYAISQNGNIIIVNLKYANFGKILEFRVDYSKGYNNILVDITSKDGNENTTDSAKSYHNVRFQYSDSEYSDSEYSDSENNVIDSKQINQNPEYMEIEDSDKIRSTIYQEHSILAQSTVFLSENPQQILEYGPNKLELSGSLCEESFVKQNVSAEDQQNEEVTQTHHTSQSNLITNKASQNGLSNINDFTTTKKIDKKFTECVDEKTKLIISDIDNQIKYIIKVLDSVERACSESSYIYQLTETQKEFQDSFKQVIKLNHQRLIDNLSNEQILQLFRLQYYSVDNLPKLDLTDDELKKLHLIFFELDDKTISEPKNYNDMLTSKFKDHLESFIDEVVKKEHFTQENLELIANTIMRYAISNQSPKILQFTAKGFNAKVKESIKKLFEKYTKDEAINKNLPQCLKNFYSVNNQDKWRELVKNYSNIDFSTLNSLNMSAPADQRYISLAIRQRRFAQTPQAQQAVVTCISNMNITDLEAQRQITEAISNGAFGEDPQVRQALVTYIDKMNTTSLKAQRNIIKAIKNKKFGEDPQVLQALVTYIDKMNITDLNAQRNITEAISDLAFGKDPQVLQALVAYIDKMNITNLNAQRNIIKAISNGAFGTDPQVLQAIVTYISKMNITDLKAQRNITEAIRYGIFGTDPQVLQAVVTCISNMNITDLDAQRNITEAILRGQFGANSVENTPLLQDLATYIGKMNITDYFAQKNIKEAIHNGKLGNNTPELQTLTTSSQINIPNPLLRSGQRDIVKAILNREFGANSGVLLEVVNHIDKMNITSLEAQGNIIKAIKNKAFGKDPQVLQAVVTCISNMNITAPLAQRNIIKAISNGAFGTDPQVLQAIVTCISKMNITDLNAQRNITEAISDGVFGKDPQVLQAVVAYISNMNITDPLAQRNIIKAISDGVFGKDPQVLQAVVAYIDKMNITDSLGQDHITRAIRYGVFGKDPQVLQAVATCISKMNITDYVVQRNIREAINEGVFSGNRIYVQLVLAIKLAKMNIYHKNYVGRNLFRTNEKKLEPLTANLSIELESIDNEKLEPLIQDLQYIENNDTAIVDIIRNLLGLAKAGKLNFNTLHKNLDGIFSKFDSDVRWHIKQHLKFHNYPTLPIGDPEEDPATAEFEALFKNTVVEPVVEPVVE